MTAIAEARDDDRAVARAAASGGQEKPQYVQRMFSDIAPRYDLLNHLLSLNVDRLWRRAAIRVLDPTARPRGRYLDLCAGTLDVGAAIVRTRGFHGAVIGADFAEPMLREGAGKAPQARLAPVAADALRLPLAADGVDGAIVAFGIRNVGDLDAALAEVLRVLRPGARFVILEFSTPPLAPVRTLYRLYFEHVLPLVGGLVSGHGTAYSYLPASVSNFPGAAELAERMRASGYRDVRWRRLTLGIAAIHTGTKP